nr:hypothetical protein Iba_chr09aCG12580 [Ipomoea batatas]
MSLITGSLRAPAVTTNIRHRCSPKRNYKSHETQQRRLIPHSTAGNKQNLQETKEAAIGSKTAKGSNGKSRTCVNRN